VAWIVSWTRFNLPSNGDDHVNIGLWVAQAVLALGFLMAGGMKVFGYEKYKEMSDRSSGKPGLSKGLVTFIGVSELAGAAGVILPMATGIMPRLTPIAAASLGFVMLLALGHHIQRKDPFAQMGGAIVLLALSVFVAYGRGITFS
jgi:uncharacterized membrane protein YphA (DoxX/SURF4 family)